MPKSGWVNRLALDKCSCMWFWYNQQSYPLSQSQLPPKAQKVWWNWSPTISNLWCRACLVIRMDLRRLSLEGRDAPCIRCWLRGIYAGSSVRPWKCELRGQCGCGVGSVRRWSPRWPTHYYNCWHYSLSRLSNTPDLKFINRQAIIPLFHHELIRTFFNKGGITRSRKLQQGLRGSVWQFCWINFFFCEGVHGFEDGNRRVIYWLSFPIQSHSLTLGLNHYLISFLFLQKYRLKNK